MLKSFASVAALLSMSAAAVAHPHENTYPVCYMDMGGVRTDLSSMCDDGSETAINIAAVAQPQIDLSAEVWTRNIHFDNVSCSSRGCFETASITGNVHNGGPVMAENIEIEAIGYAEGRTPQTRRAVISSISADDAKPVTIDFGFSVPVDSWDVRVVSWE